MRVAVDANTVISGLLFPGNERKLLVEAVAGRVDLILAEDVVEEIFDVIERKFGSHPSVRSAVALLADLLTMVVPVPRVAYQGGVPEWARRMRDPDDAPVVACAVEAGAQYLVSGDGDVLVLEKAGAVEVCKARTLLAILEEERAKTRPKGRDADE